MLWALEDFYHLIVRQRRSYGLCILVPTIYLRHMAVYIPFDNSFARLSAEFYTRQKPTPVKAPRLIAYNTSLAQALGLSVDTLEERAEVFSGNTVPDGADPLAQLYAGHQFGTYNPQLGDGRAVLLGEVVDTEGTRRDIQLKGAGPTPYSRRGDGRSWLGPVLREYLMSEAMYALGVPTTRALAAVETGETVWREDALPGAVLTRVAQSHLRVGTFQVFAARGQAQELRDLTAYAIERHYPDADGPMGLLRSVRDAQVELVAAWMSFGFIHGVMNTDNCSVAGETIDYGPCAFMDVFAHGRVFSSIDRMGRYAYGNQPNIAVWNLAQLATALIQQFDNPEDAVEEATQIVHDMPGLLETEVQRRFAAKLGFSSVQAGDDVLIDELLNIMERAEVDFTAFFANFRLGMGRDLFVAPTEFDVWFANWTQRVCNETDVDTLMEQHNPMVIPRNHRIEEAITAAVAGDYTLFHRLHRALSAPFENNSEFEDLRLPPTPTQEVKATFCGT